MANSNEIPNHPNLKARVLPHSLEAEQAVLGCVMIDEYAPNHVLSRLSEQDFYSKVHADIFAAMQSVRAKNKPVDIIMLVQELEMLGKLDSSGGLTYVTDLSNIVPSASNYMHYLEIVKKYSLLRKLITAAQKITDMAFTGDINEEALKFAESEIFKLSEAEDRSDLAHIREPLAQAVERMEMLHKDPNANKGIPTGFRMLNRILNGFQPSDLILIAARPGQGKTSIAMNFIQAAALNNDRRTALGKPDPYKCAVFSLEMPSAQLARRVLCSVAKVSMKNASSGEISPTEWKKLFSAKSKLDGAHIYIDDSSLTTPIEILSKCRRLKREKGLDLIMVDYLQLMSSGRRVESRQQEISEITRTMKIAAKELNVPILLLSQMSRDVEKRTNKEPQMSDLRESGAIEQDADIIMFIHRPVDPKDATKSDEEKSMVELHIAKHRNGETGKIDLRWIGEYTTFADVAPKGLENAVPPPNTGGFTMEDDGENEKTYDDEFTTISNSTTEEILAVSPKDSKEDMF